MRSTKRGNHRTRTRRASVAGWAVALALLVGLDMRAGADPLVVMEGGKPKPGVVSAWKGSGKKVELTVKQGADANAVASAIGSGVEKVKAKVTAGKVVVTGKTEAELLPLLAGIDVGDEGLGALAAAAMGGDELDSGSSLRAKKTADLDKLFKDQATSAQGKVVGVGGDKFPNAVVEVKILKGPTGDLATKVRKGQTVKFKPMLKMKDGRVDLEDGATQTNLGAWYLEKGDSVRVKISAEKDGAFEAEYISR